VADINKTAIGARNRQEKKQEEQEIQVLQKVAVWGPWAQIDTRSRRQTIGRQDRELDPELGTTYVVH
jgi:hypothetical protein